MGFGLSVRRLVTEIFEHNHLKFAENRKITFFLQEPLKLNSEIFYCHRTSSFNVSHRILGGGQSNFFSQSRPREGFTKNLIALEKLNSKLFLQKN